ncbi:MAG: MarR family winged helix-turn-helix transcriptional regulator [Euzebya sp.]
MGTADTSAQLPFDPIVEAKRQWLAHGWSDAADGMVLVTSLTRAQAIVQQRVDAVLKDFDLTFARFEILMLLSFSRSGEMPLAAIGRRLQVHPTSVTSAIDRLERDAMVERHAHPSDRRSKLARLTEEGQTTAKAAAAALNDQVFTQPMVPDADLDQLNNLLTQIRAAAGDF